MKTLIIHPDDDSTVFLKPIYRNIITKTVITGGVTKMEISKLINTHERIIFLGHGTHEGLSAVDQFITDDPDIVDYSMVPYLRYKKKIISIWCHADKFMYKHKLNGFFTGMFISEWSEAYFYEIFPSQYDIDESNYFFSEIVSSHVYKPTPVIFKNVLRQYKQIANRNVVAHFNYQRLKCNG